jgi:hypothetical protein
LAADESEQEAKIVLLVFDPGLQQHGIEKETD